ncbi:sensor histidine kinase [Kineosporia babensis]|uniref:histidine kinase n=1 Tax=Kineosporia babensis TaxID=499548 RepID=A0A9X1NHD6_9ACTN|nr:HAMP domain-containing histidine kinase [Kineosporia babensis]
MRTRLSALLVVLMGVVLVSLGVPLITGIASDEARTLHTDRMADLSLFVSRAPFGEDPGLAEVSALERDLQRYEELYGISVTVYDAARRPRFSNDVGSAELTPDEDAALDTALSGRLTEVWDRIEPWDTEPLVAAQPVVRDGDVVGAVVSVSPVEKAANRVLARWSILLAAGLVTMIGAIALADRLARWLLRPVERLDEAAHQISAGDLSARVPTGSGPPELRRLEASFNDMAVHVQGAVEAQREFVADASHQLRNPLAALLMRLEGLTISSGLPGVSQERQVELMQQALADGKHLAGTLDRMLALAKVENAGAPAAVLDVAAEVDERLAFWMVVADRRGVHLVRRGVSEAYARHDVGALSGALDAVLDNALKYSPEGGTVTVEVRDLPGGVAAEPVVQEALPIGGPSSAPMLALARAVGEASSEALPSGGGVEVVVSDDGPGVAEQDLPRISERFWRADSAEQEGTGLGMSIAKTLMERHDGSLEVSTSPTGGLSVHLVLPPPG